MSSQIEKLLKSRIFSPSFKKYITTLIPQWGKVLIFLLILLLISIFVFSPFKNTSGNGSLRNEIIRNNKINEAMHNQAATTMKILDNRYHDLNKRFVVLQKQYEKLFRIINSVKSSAKKQAELPADYASYIERLSLDVVDRIGEKINLNKSFSGLLTSLPHEFTKLPSYKILEQFSAHLPLSFGQLRHALEQILKKVNLEKTEAVNPWWLQKIASLFHGNIKIQKSKHEDTNLFQSVANALNDEDLKLVITLIKDINHPAIQDWIKQANDRISLEDTYAQFSDEVKNWALKKYQSIAFNAPGTKKENPL